MYVRLTQLFFNSSKKKIIRSLVLRFQALVVIIKNCIVLNYTVVKNNFDFYKFHNLNFKLYKNNCYFIF